ncbi:gamma-glutamyltransferase family protein [Variovorax sp. LT2P21]|uniref:gamma-glutamyltransferase family protein n=1 Tax=Variovorax sp. LT2P21 TaxID=3443731 RepID=UPI003F48D448
MRNFERPGRSVVMARNGMAATSHPTATLAAVNILQAGGNAMDAAIAACAVQGVVEPGSTGIGGDCFALYARQGRDDVVAFNGSGWAPAAATPAALQARGVTEWTRQSPHVVTVPGAVDAWATLAADHGTMPLAALLQPAITLAEEGFAVAPRCASDWALQAGLLRNDADAARVYLQDGQAPAEGAVHRFPELAATLRTIAAGGREAFYGGAIGRGIVEFLQSRGGLHTAEDFARYRGEYVQPIRTRFRGMDIVECPPNGQGVIALLLLNILSGFAAEGDPLSADRLHREIEAARLAYAARDAWLADPKHTPVDADWLLSPGLADELRARIDPKAAAVHVPAPQPAAHRDTVYISVVDRDRNCASFINSIFHPFGSGQLAPGGVLLHNRGQSFSLDAAHPNAIGPHKRPMHTIIPGMVVQDGRVRMPFGVMGGQYQAMGHAHFISKVLDFGLDPQAAIDLPRVFPVPGTTQVEVEGTLPMATRDELARRGFELVKPEMPIGGAQAIWIDWDTGVLHGASDPRKDGCALGH